MVLRAVELDWSLLNPTPPSLLHGDDYDTMDVGQYAMGILHGDDYDILAVGQDAVGIQHGWAERPFFFYSPMDELDDILNELSPTERLHLQPSHDILHNWLRDGFSYLRSCALYMAFKYSMDLSPSDTPQGIISKIAAALDIDPFHAAQ
jgi:hypothetical protein